MKDYLDKNIISILAIIWSIGGLAIFIMAGFGMFKDNTTILLTTTTTNVAIVLTYYFGSSKGSKDKDNLLKDK